MISTFELVEITTENNKSSSGKKKSNQIPSFPSKSMIKKKKNAYF